MGQDDASQCNKLGCLQGSKSLSNQGHISSTSDSQRQCLQEIRCIFRESVRDASHACHNDEVSTCNGICELAEVCQTCLILPSEFKAPKKLDQFGRMLSYQAWKSFRHANH